MARQAQEKSQTGSPSRKTVKTARAPPGDSGDRDHQLCGVFSFFFTHSLTIWSEARSMSTDEDYF
jgi:hypothetical protein